MKFSCSRVRWAGRLHLRLGGQRNQKKLSRFLFQMINSENSQFATKSDTFRTSNLPIYAKTNKWGINVYIIIIIIIISSSSNIATTLVDTQILGASHKLFIACVHIVCVCVRLIHLFDQHTHTPLTTIIIIVPHKYDSTHPINFTSNSHPNSRFCWPLMIMMWMGSMAGV